MWSSISVFCSRQTRTSGDERVPRSCCLRVYLLPPSGQNKPKRLFQARFPSFHFETNQIFTIRGLEQKYKSKQSGGAAFLGDVILWVSAVHSSSAQLTCAVLHSHLQDPRSNHSYWELMPVNSFKTRCMCSIGAGCSRRSFEWFFVSPTTSHPPTLSSVVRRFTQLLSKFRTSFISAHGFVFYRFMGTWCCKDAVAMRL